MEVNRLRNRVAVWDGVKRGQPEYLPVQKSAPSPQRSAAVGSAPAATAPGARHAGRLQCAECSPLSSTYGFPESWTQSRPVTLVTEPKHTQSFTATPGHTWSHMVTPVMRFHRCLSPVYSVPTYLEPGVRPALQWLGEECIWMRMGRSLKVKTHVQKME